MCIMSFTRKNRQGNRINISEQDLVHILDTVKKYTEIEGLVLFGSGAMGNDNDILGGFPPTLISPQR